MKNVKNTKNGKSVKTVKRLKKNAQGQTLSKNGKVLGRRPGSSGFSLVNVVGLRDFLNTLPDTFNMPFSNRVLRSLNTLGFSTETTPLQVEGLNEVVKAYKPTQAAVAEDLNQEPVNA